MKKIILYFMVFVISFLATSTISKTFIKNDEENLGDANEYVFSFDEKTIPNEKVVVFDNRGLDYIRYYVVEFTGNQYVCYSYYFMENKENYISKYSELSSSVVDYNYSEYMIKALDYIENGNYNDFMDTLKGILDDENLYIIY